jgi:hypothetical protein
LAQLPLVQAPSEPQLAALATQAPPTQQPVDPQSEIAQHGWPALPQATTAPPAQTVPLAVAAWPDSRQLPLTQQPPPSQALLAQQDWPGPPHEAHCLLAQEPPLGHIAASDTQMFAAGSQQPAPPHVCPAQQGWPGPPQTVQVSLLHASVGSVHVRRAQQA